MATRQENEANARFSQRYGEERGDVDRAIKLVVIGVSIRPRADQTARQAYHLPCGRLPQGGLMPPKSPNPEELAALRGRAEKFATAPRTTAALQAALANPDVIRIAIKDLQAS